MFPSLFYCEFKEQVRENFIYISLVARALKVLIQVIQCLERRVAQEALVFHPIP